MKLSGEAPCPEEEKRHEEIFDMKESKLRQVIREEIADVEAYDDVLAKVSDPEGRSIEIHRGGKILVYAKSRLQARLNLGREEMEELARALT